MTPTEKFVDTLMRLKAGDLSLLRSHAGQGLDESVNGFDLFTGTWWPLRQKSPRAPRREVAWLIAKLYACRPLPHSPGETLARQLRRSQPHEEPQKTQFQQRFDKMLTLPIRKIEPALRWALDHIASNNLALDWVILTDELSKWERETTRFEWAKQFLDNDEGG